MDTIAITSQKYNKSLPYYGYLRALPKKQHTLLICDDEPDLRLYAAMLSDDYKIIKTSSGEECIEKYNEMKDKLENITVILLDFRIGNVTGDKIARDIKEINGAKIILISAYEIDHDLIQKLKR